MSASHKLSAWLFLVLTAVMSQAARATVITCVSTPQQLKTALDAWVASSNDTYEIHVVENDYALDTGLYKFNQVTSGNNSNLRLRGGYTASCAGRLKIASNTVFDGQNAANGIFGIYANGNALIEGFTFQNFPAGIVFRDSAGNPTYVLEVSDIIGRNLPFVAITADTQIRFRDSLIYNATTSGGAVAVNSLAGNGGALVSVVNVTIANNPGNGLEITNNDSGPTILKDDIFWGNAGTGIVVTLNNGAPQPSVDHSDFQSTAGPLTLGAGNVSADPHFFLPAAGNFSLMNISPAVNTGAVSVPESYPTFDLAGHKRWVGSRVDMGAYETTIDNLTNFSVTTPNDNGNNASPLAGSLRAAIKAANASPAASRITFAVPGACPRTFTLTAALPDITNEVFVDGTSQSGWIANIQYGQLDATLCALFNGNGLVPYGLHVPVSASSARLTVNGLIFAGFTDAAIRIEGGANHRIGGNQFGAILAQANHDAIRITGNSGSTQIGGLDDPSLVNLIAGATDVGIYLDNAAGHNTVTNNVIGFQPSGTSNGANGTGIFISNSPLNNVDYNYVGNSSNGGVVLSGSGTIANALTFNSVGLDRLGASAGNDVAGISISFGANENIVGAAPGSSYGGNVIGENNGPGVWLTPSSGAGNGVLANSIFANIGLAVDLGALGVNANDAGDSDTGADNLQNYPILTRANQQPPGYLMIGSLDSSPSTSYRLDFYRDNCTNIGAPLRGSMREFLGFAYASTDASGHGGFALRIVHSPQVNLIEVAATATDPSGNTSEIGECITETSNIFKDGFE